MQNIQTKSQSIYSEDMNVSITVRDGIVTKVTTWQTGVPGSTVVYGENAIPAQFLAAKPARRRTKRVVRSAA